MRLLSLALCAGVLGSLVWGQSTPDVGSGAPNTSIQQQFQAAYFRNGFAYQVSLPPLGDVKRLGTNGLVQEFPDSAKTMGVKLALVMPNQNSAPVAGGASVLQMQAPLYAYFNTLGVNTAGMPTGDTMTCPALANSKSCQFQLFDKPYALFVYSGGGQFATRDPYYTKWANLGGVGGLGPTASDETSVTSTAGTQATAQTFDQGAIYNISSGVNNGRIFAVKQPIYAVYIANGGAQGSLGLPTSEELLQPTGRKRQSFEGGSIEYDPSNPGTPVVRAPVSSVLVTGATSPIKLNLGDSAPLQALVYASDGSALTDRTVTWTTSNSRVATVQGSGLSAVVKAVGAGTAVILATSEGKTSTPISIIVSAPCCQIGDGAPTAAIAQAFADAITRNHLSVKLPAAAPVLRVGSGYIQQFEAADSSGKTYVVGVADRTGSGYVVTGAILAQYTTIGGFGGSLGYPVADATPAGRQLFENGALAGNPVQVVAGDILAKWAALGYESGSAGAPIGAVANALTFRATRVQLQAFQNATLYAIVTGSTPSKVYASAGLILAKYTALGGPPGQFGAPLNDEYAQNGRRRQDFEGGSIDIGPGETEAIATASPRLPVVTAAPATVVAGTRVRLAVGGFNDAAKVNVSLTGQPDFTVQAVNGAYTWDAFVPQNAKSGAITVKAVDASNAASTAQGTYTVRALAEAKLRLAASRGDAQTGVPGALLPLALGIALKDDSGNVVAGMPVKFSPSPGAQIVSSSTVTDANGESTAWLRLPPREGVALVTVEAGGQMITLSAKVAASTLANYPKLNQQADGGAMPAASAAILRYHQNRAEMPTPNGPADPAALSQYLKTVCGVNAQGAQVCDGLITLGSSGDQIVNLWRLPGFSGNTSAIAVSDATLASVRDAIAAGEPALIALSLFSGDTAIGSHFVSGIGVAADASIVIADPNPAYARQNLNDYLTGFTAANRPVRGVLTGVAQLVAQSLSSSEFLVAVDAGSAEVGSNAGSCGRNFGFASTVLRYCGGSAALYELDVSASAYHGALFDLGARPNRIDLPGTGPAALKISQSGAQWTVAPMNTTVLPHGVVNAASFDERMAPGGLVTIFGSGFGRDASAVQVQFNGSPSTRVTVTPFQLNVQAPADLSPGAVTVSVTAAAGTVQQPIQISDAAPALFLMPDGTAAAINMDGSLNSAANPARRGDALVVFGTGFGATAAKGGVMAVSIPLTATLEGANLPVAFAGLTPGFPGLYQANLQIPSNTAPGLALRLSVQQENSASNTALVAVQ